MSNHTSYEPSNCDVATLIADSWFLYQGKSACNGAIGSIPRLDLHEDTEKNLVTATFELPGVSKDDVQLNFQNGKLTVSAETRKSEELAENNYLLRECLYGEASRTIQLPQGVKDEQIKATMENGLLTVTFPKTLPELAPKKIIIS
ncbi:HSP20-like chaperone [Phlegmacium glaucopus]|nr:HSP20-like chaperone [Phlegmacium glaucopus]